ncbi:hypothetical protein MBLNU457_3110t1 [Dothideomycetes sp. NU457]
MATADDAATVLEQFCHDVANLPAEIAFLLEEVQAKDVQIMQCRDAITQRDNAIQKHIRTAGSHVRHPKEDAINKAVATNFDRIEILQAEKVGLVQRAMVVLDRQVKRFDIKLRDLQTIDQFPLDPTLPSLLQPSAANAAPVASGVSTPLQNVAVNSAQGGGSANIANAAAGRAAAAGTSRVAAAIAQNPLLNQPHLAGATSRSSRESSSDLSKRRRLTGNMSLNLPTQSSNLRQSSAGASTPKAGTPGTSRAGSAQPSKAPASAGARKAPAGMKKVAPHQASSTAGRKRPRSSMLPSKHKGDRRRQLVRAGGRGSPSASPTPSDGHGSTSPTPSSAQHGHDGANDKKHARDEDAEDGDMDVEGEEDNDQLYCKCQRPSFGDMVACDNTRCKYEWFHLECVNLKNAPTGDWLCPFCSQLPESEIKRDDDG